MYIYIYMYVCIHNTHTQMDCGASFSSRGGIYAYWRQLFDSKAVQILCDRVRVIRSLNSLIHQRRPAALSLCM